MEASRTPLKKSRKIGIALLLIAICLAVAAFIVFVVFRSVQPKVGDSLVLPSASMDTPSLTIETIAADLDHPWDVALLPGNGTLVTERKGTLSMVQGSTKKQIGAISDVKVGGEGGLMGMAIDPNFQDNRFIYTCYNTMSDIRTVRFKLEPDSMKLLEPTPIVTGMPVNKSGRHSGCRLAFGPDNYLWIGTGDTAQSGLNPQPPQDPKSLGGKILRVDRDGKAAPGNMEAPFDTRIYSYGHRNTQGIAFLGEPLSGIIGYSAEHGSSIDDEVNVLKKGNFGWDPDIAYTEGNIPMTNKQKFPDAIESVWSSGIPTQAPSGLAALKSEKWKAWNGALAMPMLKAQHLKILLLDKTGKVIKEEKILADKGRLRDAELAPDGSLYVTTDNGLGKDQILRLTPN